MDLKIKELYNEKDTKKKEIKKKEVKNKNLGAKH